MKNSISHRYKAVRALGEYLISQRGGGEGEGVEGEGKGEGEGEAVEGEGEGVGGQGEDVEGERLVPDSKRVKTDK